VGLGDLGHSSGVERCDKTCWNVDSLLSSGVFFVFLCQHFSVVIPAPMGIPLCHIMVPKIVPF